MKRRNLRVLKRFGTVVNARREAIGMSQAALAEAAGLSDSYVSQLERGLKSPSLDAIMAIASALNTTAATLVAEAARNSP